MNGLSFRVTNTGAFCHIYESVEKSVPVCTALSREVRNKVCLLFTNKTITIDMSNSKMLEIKNMIYSTLRHIPSDDRDWFEVDKTFNESVKFAKITIKNTNLRLYESLR